MTNRGGGGDLRVKGAGLRRRFVLSMTLALSVVMLAAAGLLYTGATRVQERAQMDRITAAMLLSHREPRYEVTGTTARMHPSGVKIYDVRYGAEGEEGTLYSYSTKDVTLEPYQFFVPASDEKGGEALLGFIVATMALVVVAGAVVAFVVAGQVVRPVEGMIDDVRQISHGELTKKIRARGGGEIELLARSVERMKNDLASAQEAEVELSIRERELDLAGDVREALLPVTTPLMAGYDVAAIHVGSGSLGGDFHDYIERGDERVGLLVCDVSGGGMPAALIGATARSYLRAELSRPFIGSAPEALATALARVNSWLVGDVRRGVYVSALYALVDPTLERATVACAGHQVPLLRYAAEDGSLRQVHPEGIALGLDRGPVFERTLEVVEVPLDPGDRLFLCNSGPLELTGDDGREMDEKAFYGRVLKHAPLESLDFLKALRGDLERFVGEAGIPGDISLVTISREA